MSDITAPRFKSEAAARKHLESVRWPDGPICPHCGSVDNAHRIKGKTARPGLWFCAECRKQFTVTVGTLFERSKVPLHKWLLAVHLLCASKKGISTHQLHRMLGVTYKTAWFMSHRIREAMREPVYSGPLGSDGGVVEADETYIGPKARNMSSARKGPYPGFKRGQKRVNIPEKEKVLSLVERNGQVRSFHVPAVNASTLRPILRLQISKKATVMTDDASYYKNLKRDFARHESVNHSAEEYVRGDAHTNTIEGYFAIMKRGLTGVYQHVSSTHLKRYLGEFDFRYNTREVDDLTRTNAALKGIEGKRLTYRRTDAG